MTCTIIDIICEMSVIASSVFHHGRLGGNAMGSALSLCLLYCYVCSEENQKWTAKRGQIQTAEFKKWQWSE